MRHRIIAVVALLSIVGEAKTQAVGAEVPSILETALLVQQLGDDSYTARETAQQMLIEMGAPALSEVRAGLSSDDLEVAERCRRILAVIGRDDWEKLRDDFLTGKTDAPGWREFREVAGDSFQARCLYLEMIEAEPALILTAVAFPRTADAVLAAKIRMLEINLTAETTRGGDGLYFAKVMSFYFVAGMPDVELSESTLRALHPWAQWQLVGWTASFGELYPTNPAARRIASRTMKTILKNDALFTQCYQADNFHLLEFAATLRDPVQCSIKDVCERHPSDLEAMYKAYWEAHYLELTDTIEMTIKPVFLEAVYRELNSDSPKIDWLINAVNTTRVAQIIAHEDICALIGPTLYRMADDLPFPCPEEQFTSLWRLDEAAGFDDVNETVLKPRTVRQIEFVLKQPFDIKAFEDARSIRNLVYDSDCAFCEQLDEFAIQFLLQMLDKTPDSNDASDCFKVPSHINAETRLLDTVLPAWQATIALTATNSRQGKRLSWLVNFSSCLSNVAKPRRDWEWAAQQMAAAAAMRPIDVEEDGHLLGVLDIIDRRDDRDLAWRLLRTDHLLAPSQAKALIYLFAREEKETLPLLQNLLDDHRVIWTEKTKVSKDTGDLTGGAEDKIVSATQMRDVALLGIVLLTEKKSFSYYGFGTKVGLFRDKGGVWRLITYTALHPLHAGFGSEEARAAADDLYFKHTYPELLAELEGMARAGRRYQASR